MKLSSRKLIKIKSSLTSYELVYSSPGPRAVIQPGWRIDKGRFIRAFGMRVNRVNGVNGVT